ncbi:glycosyltransferase [Demequina maris]|uniref:glycosyltransferase n=1 Tax=Demequina maris TaxID=1638982 RepID=UPI0009E1EF45|nr:glycosyltransferase [Demequina maris]
MKRLIAFDARAIEGNYSGVRDIAVGLLEGLRIYCSEVRNIQVVAVGSSQESAVADEVLASRGFMEFGLPRLAQSMRASAIFVPRQTAPMLRTVPTYAVFHDVGFLDIPGSYTRDRRMRATTRWAGASARALTVSEFTRERLAARGITRSARALPIGAIHDYRRTASTSTDGRRYLLYVAAFQPHKNVERLVSAWEQAETEGYDLVVCGRGGARESAVHAAVRSSRKAESIHLVSGLSSEDYGALFSNAHAYIQPSFYEGLGIPALDAAAMGTPIAVAGAAHLGRVFADGPPGMIFDPSRVTDIARAIEQLLHDPSSRGLFSDHAKATVRLTDWVQVAREALHDFGK